MKIKLILPMWQPVPPGACPEAFTDKMPLHLLILRMKKEGDDIVPVDKDGNRAADALKVCDWFDEVGIGKAVTNEADSRRWVFRCCLDKYSLTSGEPFGVLVLFGVDEAVITYYKAPVAPLSLFADSPAPTADDQLREQLKDHLGSDATALSIKWQQP